MWSLHSHFDHHRRCRTRRTTTASLSSRPRQPWQSPRHKDHDNNNHHHSYNNHYSSSDDDEYYEPRQQSKHRHGDGYHRVDDRVIAPHEEQAFLRTLLFMVSTDHRSEREHDKDDNEQPPQQQQPQQYQPHVVLPDDTWQGICLRYKITPLQLRRANGGFSGTQLTLAPPVLKIPVTQPKNNNNTSSSSTMTTRQQDTSSPAYKLQVLRHHFPTLNVEQAQAFLEVHDGDLQAAQQSLLQLCGGGGVHVSSSAGGTTE